MRQTEAEFEVVAIDDGSSDGSGEALDAAARRDRRIVVQHTAPRGLPAALNAALGLARAPWVARHDADDLSHRRRFERQLAFLAARPELDVVGTRVRLFPDAQTGPGMRRWAAWHNALLEHEEIRAELLIDSPLAHGTGLIRRHVLENAGGWHERGWAEDLDLWVRLFAAGARFAKIPETLYGWRQHPHSSTRTDPRYSHVNFMSLKIAALDSGFLERGRRATLLGVGRSLERWRTALGARIAAFHDIGRGPVRAVGATKGPYVLALMAAPARRRWRTYLTGLGCRELRDFIFVA
jgi:glycosyltransferase involved in cell wall biosynthesis